MGNLWTENMIIYGGIDWERKSLVVEIRSSAEWTDLCWRRSIVLNSEIVWLTHCYCFVGITIVQERNYVGFHSEKRVFYIFEIIDSIDKLIDLSFHRLDCIYRVDLSSTLDDSYEFPYGNFHSIRHRVAHHSPMSSDTMARQSHKKR
jgi:hypothetical protein